MNEDKPSEITEFHEVDRFARLTQWLTVCSKAMHRLFTRELAAVDLSPAEFILLWTCAQSRNSTVSQTQLASFTGVSPAQLSQTADRLRRRGWIALTRSSVDRRRQSLELTPEGAATLREAAQHLNGPAKRILNDLPDSPQTQFAAMLRQFAESVQHCTAADDGSSAREAA